MRGLIRLSALCLALACASASSTRAQPDDAPQAHVPDQLFPGNLRGAAALATGLPFVAMGELSLGLGDRFALDALAGVTPRVYALGGRARALLLDRRNLRLSLVAPLLYYPKTHLRLISCQGSHADQRSQAGFHIAPAARVSRFLHDPEPPADDELARREDALRTLLRALESPPADR